MRGMHPNGHLKHNLKVYETVWHFKAISFQAVTIYIKCTDLNIGTFCQRLYIRCRMPGFDHRSMILISTILFYFSVFMYTFTRCDKSQMSSSIFAGVPSLTKAPIMELCRIALCVSHASRKNGTIGAI